MSKLAARGVTHALSAAFLRSDVLLGCAVSKSTGRRPTLQRSDQGRLPDRSSPPRWGEPLDGRRSRFPLSASDPRLKTFNFNDERFGFAARQPIKRWQLYSCVVVFGLMVGAGLVDHRVPLTVSMFLLTSAFLVVVIVRLIALREVQWVKRRLGAGQPAGRVPDDQLPRYSILIALYDEARSVPSLIAALRALDYPRDRLDILFVVEADDPETTSALLARQTMLPFRVIVAAASGPRTKPKALNCGLSAVIGDYIVVYDAEDRPEPDQLRKVIDVYRRARWYESSWSATHHPRLVCVQAELNIFNAHENWLTRQFAIEYSLLFSAILPGFVRMGWPVPLGGTSNHFETEALLSLGGWDPYNVTEDADLGVRIARERLGTALVSSITWEEAPRTFKAWLRQRTRWIKGWLVTLLVHTREPKRLTKDLGFKRAVGLLLVFGSMLLSAFCNPLAVIGIAFWLSSSSFHNPATDGGFSVADADDGFMQIVHIVAIGNFVVGYGVAMIAAALATRTRQRNLVHHVLLMPLYWLLISLAAMRAAWQLLRDPHKWEKTPHGEL